MADMLKSLQAVCRRFNRRGLFEQALPQQQTRLAILVEGEPWQTWGVEAGDIWHRLHCPVCDNIVLELATPRPPLAAAKQQAHLLAETLAIAIEMDQTRRQLADETLERYRESALVLRAATSLPDQLDKPVIAERLLSYFPDILGAALLTGKGVLLSGTGVFKGRKGLSLPLPDKPTIHTFDKNLANLATLYYPLPTEEALCLLLAHNEPHFTFTTIDMHRVATLASIAATAFNNARLLRIRTALSRYMPPPVIEQLVRENSEDLEGREQQATILFADIRNFTPTTAQLGAKGTVRLLNTYYSEAVQVIREYGGMVDKFLGDGLLAVFGVPFPAPDDADNALLAALALQEVIAEKADQFPVPVKVGVGISSGSIISGNVGSHERLDFTVIGTPVNLAAKLQDFGKQQQQPVVLSESTWQLLSPAMAARCRLLEAQYNEVAVYVPDNKQS